jgi:hypothetical protein
MYEKKLVISEIFDLDDQNWVTVITQHDARQMRYMQSIYHKHLFYCADVGQQQKLRPKYNMRPM